MLKSQRIISGKEETYEVVLGAINAIENIGNCHILQRAALVGSAILLVKNI